jgi:signal transduction histidine kinase
MERETIQLQALINDLFTLARAEVGRLDLHLAPVDLAATARQVVEAMAPLAWQSRRVEVVVDPSPQPPPLRGEGEQMALADAGRIQQIVQNLLHNAVRHTPPGGIVAVSVSAPDEYTVGLCVRDTGEGIAPADLPHIWERFYRARAGQESGGTGLGLALVKEMAEAMGGSVGVESAPGEGSSFTVRLPRAPRTDARSSVPTHELVAP